MLSVLIESSILHQLHRQCQPCRGSVNTMLLGYPKVWYIAPPDFAEKAAAYFGDDIPTYPALLTKRLFHRLPVSELKKMGVRRVMQPPGYMMLTCAVSGITAMLYAWSRHVWNAICMQGYAWHSTCSLGFSIAEASNFFNDGMGLQISEAVGMYAKLQKLAKDACVRHSEYQKEVKQSVKLSEIMLHGARKNHLL